MQQPSPGLGRLIVEVSNSYTVTHHTRQNFSGRGIGPSQRWYINITMRKIIKNYYVCSYRSPQKIINGNTIQTQFPDQRMEEILETLVYSPFNHLKRLLVQEYFTEFGRCEIFKLCNTQFTQWFCFTCLFLILHSLSPDPVIGHYASISPPPPVSFLLAAGWRLSCRYKGSLRTL